MQNADAKYLSVRHTSGETSLDARILSKDERGTTRGIPTCPNDEHHWKGIYVFLDAKLLTLLNFNYFIQTFQALGRQAYRLETCLLLHAVELVTNYFPVVALTAFLKSTPKLKKLDLRCLNLQGSQQQFLEFTKQCQNLEELYYDGVENAQVSPYVADSLLVAAATSKMKRLHLRCLELTARNADALRQLSAAQNLEYLHLEINLNDAEVVAAAAHAMESCQKLVHVCIQVTSGGEDETRCKDSMMRLLARALSVPRIYVLELQMQGEIMSHCLQPWVEFMESNYSCHQFRLINSDDGSEIENEAIQRYVKQNDNRRCALLSDFQPNLATPRGWADLSQDLGADHADVTSEDVLTGLYLYVRGNIGSLAANLDPSSVVPTKRPTVRVASEYPRPACVSEYPKSAAHRQVSAEEAPSVDEEVGLPSAAADSTPSLDDWDIVLTMGQQSSSGPNLINKGTTCWQNGKRRARPRGIDPSRQDCISAFRILRSLVSGEPQGGQDVVVRFYVSVDQAQQNPQWVLDWSDKRAQPPKVYVRANNDCVQHEIDIRKARVDPRIVQDDSTKAQQQALSSKESKFAKCAIEVASKEQKASKLWTELAKAKQAFADGVGRTPQRDEYAGWVDVLARDYVDRTANMKMLTEVKESLDRARQLNQCMLDRVNLNDLVSLQEKDSIFGRLGHHRLGNQLFRTIVQQYTSNYGMAFSHEHEMMVLRDAMHGLEAEGIRLVAAVGGEYYMVKKQYLAAKVRQVLRDSLSQPRSQKRGVATASGTSTVGSGVTTKRMKLAN